jgi:3-oxosteroid 1-dehydrogenase
MSLPVGATELMDESWWMPITLVPGEPKPYLVLFERFTPRFVMVDGSGRRHVNEAAPYHIVGRAMIDRNSPVTPSIPSWFIMDSRYLRRYSFGPAMPPFPPKKLLRNRFLEKAKSLADLADTIGVDQAALIDTISRHNQFAITGQDSDFGRGDQVFDRTYADPVSRRSPAHRSMPPRCIPVTSALRAVS